MTNRTMVDVAAQPTSGACTTANTRINSADVLVTAPMTSKCDQLNAARGDFTITRAPTTSSSSATGPGKISVARHDSSVSNPPKTRPRENPLAPHTV